MKRRGWLIAGLSTLGMVAYIPALQRTSVANVAVINATYPFVTAAFAWAWYCVMGGLLPNPGCRFLKLLAETSDSRLAGW